MNNECTHHWERMGYSMLRCTKCGEGESAVNEALKMQDLIKLLRDEIEAFRLISDRD